MDTIGRLTEELTDDDFKIVDIYSSDFSDAVIFKRKYSNCPMKEIKCAIGANCKVYWCQDKAYLSDGEVCDFSNQSFEEAWNAPETVEKFLCFDAMKVCGQHCVSDARNEMINEYLENGAEQVDFTLEPKHVNFI